MSREIMQQALNALEYHTMQTRPISHTDKAIEALRQALAQPEIPMSPEHLPQYIATNNIKPTTEGGGGAGGAQPEQEPVAWMVRDQVDGCRYPSASKNPAGSINGESQPLYTAPPKPWVGLTDEEIEDTWGNTPMMFNARDGGARRVFAHAIEAKLKELNT